jgi:hypothetical protein
LIDGRVFNHGVNVNRNLPETIREMRDIEARLKRIDELEIYSGTLSIVVSLCARIRETVPSGESSSTKTISHSIGPKVFSRRCSNFPTFCDSFNLGTTIDNLSVAGVIDHYVAAYGATTISVVAQQITESHGRIEKWKPTKVSQLLI